MTYFSNIKRGIKTTMKGLGLTLHHLWAARNTKGPLNVQDDDYFKINEGYVTLEYPHQKISVPDIGRYQLDCEIDDCIVCDKCAKICPVDCIEIEAIKSPELIRTTSDGSPVRLHAAKFNIDLAKCCFCGLCTTVCPTECLTMNSQYDYSVVDITQLNFAFANLSEKEAKEKRELYELYLAEKEASKQLKNDVEEVNSPKSGVNKPIFKPKMVAMPINEENKTIQPQEISESDTKPKFVPKFKPSLTQTKTENLNESDSDKKETSAIISKIQPSSHLENITLEVSESKPVAFKPKLKPLIKPSNSEIKTENPILTNDSIKKEEIAKPIFVPKLKPQSSVGIEKKEVRFEEKPVSDNSTIQKTEEGIEPPKKFIPKLKPKD